MGSSILVHVLPPSSSGIHPEVQCQTDEHPKIQRSCRLTHPTLLSVQQHVSSGRVHCVCAENKQETTCIQERSKSWFNGSSGFRRDGRASFCLQSLRSEKLIVIRLYLHFWWHESSQLPRWDIGIFPYYYMSFPLIWYMNITHRVVVIKVMMQ